MFEVSCLSPFLSLSVSLQIILPGGGAVRVFCIEMCSISCVCNISYVCSRRSVSTFWNLEKTCVDGWCCIQSVWFMNLYFSSVYSYAFKLRCFCWRLRNSFRSAVNKTVSSACLDRRVEFAKHFNILAVTNIVNLQLLMTDWALCGVKFRMLCGSNIVYVTSGWNG